MPHALHVCCTCGESVAWAESSCCHAAHLAANFRDSLSARSSRLGGSEDAWFHAGGFGLAELPRRASDLLVIDAGEASSCMQPLSPHSRGRSTML